MRRMLFLVAVTLASVGFVAAPAFGEIEGDCDAYFNGIHFDDIDTAAEAKELLVVQPGETLNLSGTIYGDIDVLRVDVVFRPFVLTLADEYEPDSEAGGIETFNIDLPIEFLATYGSGIYEFQGSTDICSGNAFFILGGVEVWETLIGQVALGTAGLGGLIGLTSWIPTLFTGRVGWGRDIFGGILIGIGAAVVAQQAGEVPLGAMSAGVGVAGGIGGSILIDKVCAGINGVFSGGGSALPPPPSAPPPQSFPDAFQGAGPDARPEFTRSADTFQGNQPEFTRSADTFQGNQPEFTRSADTFQGNQPEPEFTRSADTFQGDRPQVKPDSADAFGGATQPTGQAPDVTSISDTFQPGQPDVTQAADTLPADQPQVKPDSADAFGGATQPTGQAPDVTSISDTFQPPTESGASTAGAQGQAPEMTSISDTFQPPTGDAATGSPTTSPPPADGQAAGAGGQAAPSTSSPGSTPPGSTASPSSPAGQPGSTSPGSTASPSSPASQGSPPDLTAPGQPASTPPGSSASPSSPAGQVSPPDLTAPGQPGVQPGGTGPGPAGSVSPGATPSGGTPTSTGPAPGAPSSGPGVTAPGGGVPMAAIAGVAAPVALTSLAKAAAQYKKGKASAKDAYWFYVDAGTPVFSMDDHTRQVGELRPGTWYLARAGYEEWVHMKDDDANLEGWVPGWAVKRQG